MTPEQLKKVCVYLAFGLIVALAWIVFDCQGDKEINLSQNAKISRLEHKDRENAKLQASQDSIIGSERHARENAYRTAKKSDSLFHVERSGIQRTLKQLLAIRQTSGVRVDTITVAIEGRYKEGAKADSIQIQKLEARILSDSASFETEIKGWVTKFDSQVSITEGWRLQAVESTRDATKYKRQRNKARLAAGVLGAVVALWVIDKVKD